MSCDQFLHIGTAELMNAIAVTVQMAHHVSVIGWFDDPVTRAQLQTTEILRGVFFLDALNSIQEEDVLELFVSLGSSELPFRGAGKNLTTFARRHVLAPSPIKAPFVIYRR